MNLAPDQILLIETFSKKKYRELDTTHGLSHGIRTARLAVYIAQKEDVDVELCRLGALLHQFHPDGAIIVDDFLKDIGIDDDIRQKLVHCVECIEPETIGHAKTIEAKVVFDADKLQTLGPFGLVREIAYRVHILGIDLDTAIVQAQKLQAQMFDLIQTKTGRKLAVSVTEPMPMFFHLIEEWNYLSFMEFV